MISTWLQSFRKRSTLNFVAGVVGYLFGPSSATSWILKAVLIPKPGRTSVNFVSFCLNAFETGRILQEIASCASGTSDGFLKVRPERRCIPMTLSDATYYAYETIDDFRTHVDQSELDQRGWVMQERALSRRAIYSVENQSYWECGGGVRCETMTKMRKYALCTTPLKLSQLVTLLIQGHSLKASFLGDANFPQSAEQYVKGLKIEFFHDQSASLHS